MLFRFNKIKKKFFLKIQYFEIKRNPPKKKAPQFLHPKTYYFLFLKKDFIYLFLEREEERERNIRVWLPLVRPLLGTWPATQTCALTGH